MRKMLLAALGVVLVVADNRERVSPGERSQSWYVETQRGEVYMQSRSATPKWHSENRGIRSGGESQR